MAWLYVPGLECSTKGFVLGWSISGSNTALSVTSKGKLMQPRYLSAAWRKEPWIRRLSGLTFAPSTAQRGADSWISSLRDSRASRIPSLESAKAFPTNDGSGPTSSSAFAKLGPASSGWRMCPGSSAQGDSQASFKTWPRSGSMLNGIAFQRRKRVQAKSGNGYSFWPTARANDSEKRGLISNNSCSGLPAAVLWQSPLTSDANGSRETDGKRSLGLNTQASAWPTPMAMDSNSSGSDKAGMVTLTARVRNWPTPLARDYKGPLVYTGGGSPWNRRHRLANFRTWAQPRGLAIDRRGKTSPRPIA